MGSGAPRIDRSTVWLPATVSGNPPFLLSNGGLSVVHYLTNITFDGAVLLVTAYSVLVADQGNLNMTSYVSEYLHFPVEYMLSFGNGPPVTLRLERTNIPGLLP